MEDELSGPGQKQFERHCALLWANLSRLNGLMVIANLSLFFLTRLVVEKGYYYTFYSLFFLGLVARAPHSATRPFSSALVLSLLVLILEWVGIYFLVSSG
jgi:hypothetical protein